MNQTDYAQFSARLHGRIIAERIPASGTIEVTRRCPLACSHCYNNLPVGDRAARSGELSLDEHRRIIDELAEAGCLWLLLTGGEIFARADFLDIYTHAKRRGLLVTLFTNGTMITPRIADYLAEWPPFAIEITLYGGTRETYERLTGVPGSFDRCIRGIDLLLERGLPLKLKTVAVTINAHEIPVMARIASDRGLEFKFDAMINARIDCSHSPLATRLGPEEIVDLDLRDPARMAEWSRFGEQFIAPPAAGREDDLYQCGGGITTFAIDPEGKLSICVLSHVDTYDLRRGSFAEGWQKVLRAVRSRKITRETKCVGCHLKALCGMCPANGEIEHKDPEEPIDFFCQVAHLRAMAMGTPIPPHGDCEYCAGGAGHPQLLASAEALRRGEVVARRAPLPVVSSGGGGCGSCAGACS